MSDVVKGLEDRIRRLKSDAIARQDWFRLRIEIEKQGGRWEAPNGLVFELKDGAIYQYLSDYKERVSQLVVTCLDAPVPYVAELSLDLQGTPPAKRSSLLKELSDAAAKLSSPPSEVVVIVKKDWLTKISLARWGTINWKRHLKPTEMTHKARRARGRKFNPDLIYPGDTFEVIA